MKAVLAFFLIAEFTFSLLMAIGSAQDQLVPTTPVAVEAVVIARPVSPKGVPVMWPCEENDMVRNVGSKVDHAGITVASCIDVMGRVANCKDLRGFAEWAKYYPGGHYPSKIDKQIKAWSEGHQFPVDKKLIVQSTTDNPEFVKLQIKHGPVGVSYNGLGDKRYGGARIIYSFVVLLHYDEAKDEACFADPNFVKPDQIYTWITAAEMRKRMLSNKEIWAIALAKPAKDNP